MTDLDKLAQRLEGTPGVSLPRDAFGHVTGIHHQTPNPIDECVLQQGTAIQPDQEIADVEVDPYSPAGSMNVTIKTRPRGGARPGSGRKPIKDEDRKRNVTVSFRVNAATRDALQGLRTQGIDINAELEKLVARLTKRDTKG